MTKDELIELQIVNRIYIVRGQKVMLDSELADLYGVSTSRLNEQVSRNIKRFPDDFMYRLTGKEFLDLKSQNATSSWGGRRKLPYVFTEQGVAMLASVLKSDRAIEVNIAIVRTFVKLRKLFESNTDLAQTFMVLQEENEKKDQILRTIYGVIDTMISDEDTQIKIGFEVSN